MTAHFPTGHRRRSNSLACSDIDILPDLIEDITGEWHATPKNERVDTKTWIEEEPENTPCEEVITKKPISSSLSVEEGIKMKYFIHKDTNYDFQRQRSESKQRSNSSSTGHIFKSCLGGSVLAIHDAYRRCGVWTSVATSLILGYCIAYGIHLTVKSAQTLYMRLHIPELSYSKLAEAAMDVGPFPRLRKYSKLFRYLVEFTTCVNLFGVCCVYQLIIARIMKELFGSIQNLPYEDLDLLRFYVLILLVPTIVLCMMTRLKHLSPFVVVADLIIVTCAIAMVYYTVKSPPSLSDLPPWKTPMGFLQFCGVFAFSIEGVAMALPIENNMKNPEKFTTVMGVGMSGVVSLSLVFGVLGYWRYGEDSLSPVILNFPPTMFPTILKYSIAVLLFISFANIFWTPFNMVWHYLSRRHTTRFRLWERVYRTIFVIIVTCVAIAFPKLESMMGLLGAFCISSLGFIFPAFIDLLVTWENPGLGKLKWRLWKNILLITIGLVLFFAGTYSNGKELINNL
ncbi:proton-coupled amino acid transporter-like protein CG1139 [Aricia agestis]|uniref:proton-coupled amino acid transporter-like protein CG1139 n=1 Tax=Aricia agestis TaxID=91739 RepID=UPI001C206CB2|nr:proton-coupled amino acid transporter-like protein CG1139 [Aricia agestis]